MEPVGILKAWTIQVRAKTAKIRATRSASATSWSHGFGADISG